MKMNLDEVIKIIARSTSCRECEFIDDCSDENYNNNDFICNQAISFLEELKKNHKEE